MKLEIPGQLRGPETRTVMKAAIQVRRELEGQFAEINDARTVSSILRVGGSLGTFGQDGIENIVVNANGLECDVVIAARDWATLDAAEIHALVRSRAIEALSVLLIEARIEPLPRCLVE